MRYKNLEAPRKSIVIGIFIIFLVGSLMHFLYEITGNNPFVGSIAPVNESVWEHLKMLPLPMIGWWFIYYILRGDKYSIDKNKWFTSALIALVTSIITIPLLYYFYTEAFGVEIVIVDILILFIAVLIGQLLGLYSYKNKNGINSTVAICIILLIVIVFVIFTFYPPQLPLFKDTSTGLYGIQ
jgi:hypothetical protein